MSKENKEIITNLNISSMSSKDYQSWCQIIDTTWPGLPHTLEHDFVALVGSTQTSLAAIKDNQMVGASLNTLHLDQGNLYLYVHMIGVPEAHQNQGIGTALMKQNLELVKNHQAITGMRLTSDPLDTRNVRLYLNHSSMISHQYKEEAYHNLGESGGEQHKNLPSDRLLYQYTHDTPWSTSRVLPDQKDYQDYLDQQSSSLVASAESLGQQTPPIVLVQSLLDLEACLKANPLKAQQARQFHRQVLPELFSLGYTAVDQVVVKTTDDHASCIVLLKDFDQNDPDCLVRSIN